MTQSLPTKKGSTPENFQQRGIQLRMPDPETIRASTPIMMALIGGVIGISVLFLNPTNNAGFGLATAAISGAAGLAQPHKEQREENK